MNPSHSKRQSIREALAQWRQTLNLSASPTGTDEDTICPTCNGAGWVLPYAGAAIQDAHVCPALCPAAQTFITQRRTARFRRAGIPAPYQALTFATFEALTLEQKLNKWLAYAALRDLVDPANALHISRVRLAQRLQAQFGAATPARVLHWLSEPDVVKRGVVLQGEAGVGKTGLTIAATNALLDQGQDVRYMRVYDLMVALRSTWHEGSERDLLHEFQTCPILVLDEFNLTDAAAVARPHQAEYMTAILRCRQAAGLPTLITCNISKDQFYAQWGVQCADVVMVLCHWIAVGGLKLRATDDDLGDAL